MAGGAMASEEALVTYSRRRRRAPDSDCDADEEEADLQKEASSLSPSQRSCHPPATTPPHTGLSKCRQYFLDFGQTDFACSTCRTCGLLYARGHSEDERLHACFHKRYLHGTSFKGWQRERIVVRNEGDNGRIILILNTDPLQHRLKVYLYIHSKKVMGCAVTESISNTHHILSRKSSQRVASLPIKTRGCQIDIRQCLQPHVANTCSSSEVSSELTNVQTVKSGTFENKASQGSQKDFHCGQKSLVYITGKLCSETNDKQKHGRALTTVESLGCTKTSGAPVCGIRGLWVTKSERRRGIATRLLDTVRTSFVYGLVLDVSQVAFFQPTPDGITFAANYSKTDSYLVYS